MPEKLTREELLEQIKKAQTGLAEVRSELQAEESALNPQPGFVASANISPVEQQEEAGIKKEIENLPKEDKEKLGGGLATIGYRLEKNKNDIFAGFFNYISSKLPKGSSVSDFASELKETFVRDSKTAEEKIKDVISGKDKHRFGNAATLTGNIVKYGRVLADGAMATKAGVAVMEKLGLATVFAPRRYVMMIAMATARIGEAGKETRLKNSELKEKVRIGRTINWTGDIQETLTDKDKADVDRAFDEAISIYEKAGGTWTQEESANGGGSGDLSAESLKETYLREMPKSILKKIQDPSLAKSLMQKVFQKQIEASFWILNKRVELIHAKNSVRTKLGFEESDVKAKELALFNSYKKDLSEYERMIEDAGTIDFWAMMGKNLEKGSKGVVIGMTIDTLIKSLSHGYELMRGHGGDAGQATAIKPTQAAAQPTPTPSSPEVETTTTTESPKTAIKTEDSPAPQGKTEATETRVDTIATPKAPDVQKVEITFDKGKGGLQGILDLKEKLKAEYPDLSKAPAGVQKFIEGDFVEQAKSKGLKFLSEDGKSSLKIFEGATLKLDAEGNPVFTNLGSNDEVYIANKVEAVKPGEFVGPPEPEKVTPEPAPVAADTETPNKTLENNPKAEALKKLGYSGDPKDIVAVNRFLKDDFFASHDIERPLSTPESLQDAADTAVETIRQNRQNVLDQYPVQPEISDAGRHIEPLEHFFGYTKGVAGNPLNLSDKTLEAVDETYSRNIAKFFEDPNVGWTRIKMLPAHNVLKYNGPFAYKGFTFDQKDAGPVSQYLRKLVEVTGLKPKNSWFFGRESVQHYMARALQKAADKGYLEKLK